MGLRKSFTSNRDPEYTAAMYLEPMQKRWAEKEAAKKEAARLEAIALTEKEQEKEKNKWTIRNQRIARLENQKVNITKKIEQLDHSKARYLQSIGAIDEAIVELEKGELMT